MRAHQLSAFAVTCTFAVSLIAGSGAEAGPSADTGHSAVRGYYIGVAGIPIAQGTVYSEAEVLAMPTSTSATAHHTSAFVAASVRDTVTPFSVASGYVLYNPGYRRTSYIYDSDWGPATELYCSNSGCTATDQWQTQLHEYVTGGTSKLWQLKLNARRVYGTDAVSLDYWYACAINVSGSPDHYCQNGADLSQVTGPLNPGDTLYKYFEYNTYSNIEYPMVAIGVHFAHVYVQDKYRGFDTCASNSSTKLCNTSGTGG
jgi:hypothetical protein